MAKVLLPLLLLSSPLQALSLWPYPEAADGGSLYAGVFAPALSVTGGFAVYSPDLFFDFMIPGGFPLSLGAFMETPAPNLKHFGPRTAVHFDIEDPKTDLYFLYAFDFGFTRNALLLEYNDEPVERRYYDFRAGIRYRFGKYTALSLETGFKLDNIRFGIAVKVN